MQKISNSQQSGFLLIASLFVLTGMMIMVSFYLSAVRQNAAIAAIVDATPQARYLAESGVQEALWKLQHDAAYSSNFETNASWSTSFVRNDVPVAGGSYAVAIENMGLGHGSITATSTISVGNAQIRRVARAYVFKPTTSGIEEDIALLANQDIYGADSDITVTDGTMHANGSIILDLYSDWSTNVDAQAVLGTDISVSSVLDADTIYSPENPPAPDTVGIPEIDFDSEDENSLKSRADQTYTATEFAELLENYPTTSLNGITYVTGNATIPKGVQLTINGALIADGSIGIGTDVASGSSTAAITVNKTPGEPSGLISKKHIRIGGQNASADIAGLVYAGGTFSVSENSGESVSVAIDGGIVAQYIRFWVTSQEFDITYSQTNIEDSLGTPAESQLYVYRWEEAY